MHVYDRWLQRYPVPFESCMVETRFGTTHILASGHPAAPPLLLIYGGGLISWFEDMQDRHRVSFADDTIAPG